MRRWRSGESGISLSLSPKELPLRAAWLLRQEDRRKGRPKPIRVRDLSGACLLSFLDTAQQHPCNPAQPSVPQFQPGSGAASTHATACRRPPPILVAPAGKTKGKQTTTTTTHHHTQVPRPAGVVQPRRPPFVCVTTLADWIAPAVLCGSRLARVGGF